MKTITFIVLLLFASATSCRAQQGLAINQAYARYGYLPEAREVKLAGKSVAKYKLSLFHSIEISHPTEGQVSAFCQMLKVDTQQATAYDVKHHPDGNLHSAFYCLPSKGRLRRYIFYKQTTAQVSLIYIEGKATLEEMKDRFAH